MSALPSTRSNHQSLPRDRTDTTQNRSRERQTSHETQRWVDHTVIKPSRIPAIDASAAPMTNVSAITLLVSMPSRFAILISSTGHDRHAPSGSGNNGDKPYIVIKVTTKDIDLHVRQARRIIRTNQHRPAPVPASRYHVIPAQNAPRSAGK